MTGEMEKFLSIEENANKLLDSISSLEKEVGNYKLSRKALDDVSLELLDLIKTTKEISQSSIAAVNIFKEIGGPRILEEIAKLDSQLAGNKEKLLGLEGMLTDKFNQLDRSFKSQDEKNEVFKNSLYLIDKKVFKLFIFLIATTFFSLAGLIISLVLLLMK